MSSHFSTATSQLYAAYDADEAFADLDVRPGERIGQPMAKRWHGVALRLAVVAIAGLAAAGTHFADPTLMPRLWSAASTSATPALTQAWQRAAEIWSKNLMPSEPQDAPPAATTPAVVAATAAPAPLPIPVEVALAPAPLPPTAATTDTPPAPLPKLKAIEPYQKRAEAAGLHPLLSRALLERLTAADYRNAATAIERAVAETSDNGLFTWPQPRKPDLALFEVSFVPSATPECRRYIVTIAKDGWLTTALPMEKCGVPQKQAKR